jgi:hypothetical protein
MYTTLLMSQLTFEMLRLINTVIITQERYTILVTVVMRWWFTDCSGFQPVMRK